MALYTQESQKGSLGREGLVICATGGSGMNSRTMTMLDTVEIHFVVPFCFNEASFIFIFALARLTVCYYEGW